MRNLVLVLVALVPVLSAGCYHYVPADAMQVEPGTEVTARLAAPGRVALNDVTVQDAMTLHGPLVHRDQDSLVVSVWWVEGRREGSRYIGGGELISLPSSQVAQLHERTLSRSKSFLFAGIIGAAIGTAAIVLFSGETGGEGGGDGGDPVRGVRVPVW